MKRKEKNSDPEEDLQDTGKKRKRRKKILTIVIVILAIAVALIGAVYAVFHHYYSKSNYVSDSDVAQYSEDQLPEDVLRENGLDSMSEEARRKAEEDAKAAQDIEFANGSYVYNLPAHRFGPQRRQLVRKLRCHDAGLHQQKKPKTIYLTSFMRDSYALVVRQRGRSKLNYAYAAGGGPYLVETIETELTGSKLIITPPRTLIPRHRSWIWWEAWIFPSTRRNATISPTEEWETSPPPAPTI